MTKSAFQFAHFRATNDFTPDAGNRAPARHHNRNRTSGTQAPNGIRSLGSAHDK